MSGERTSDAATRGVRAIVYLAQSRAAQPEADLRDFTRTLLQDVEPHLERVTGTPWTFDVGEPVELGSSAPRTATDFLDEAMLRMVENPADVVIVVTDVGLLSQRRRLVPGLASSTAQVAVVSTRRLIHTPFGEPLRSLNADAVRWNAATLLLHLLGHTLDVGHAQEAGFVMSPFAFDDRRRDVPPFSEASEREFASRVQRLEERERPARGWLETVRVHLELGFAHPRRVIGPAVRSRAPLLALRLGKILAAAVTPTFILLFTDEFWWAGIEIAPAYLWSAVATAILVATWFVPRSQQLFFPHRESRILTHSVALTNVAIVLSTFLMMVGLFVMVVLLIVLVEWWLFPSDYIAEWFQDRGFSVGWSERFRLAVLVSILGTLTGALGGGFHGKDILRELALFDEET